MGWITNPLRSADAGCHPRRHRDRPVHRLEATMGRLLESNFTSCVSINCALSSHFNFFGDSFAYPISILNRAANIVRARKSLINLFGRLMRQLAPRTVSRLHSPIVNLYGDFMASIQVATISARPNARYENYPLFIIAGMHLREQPHPAENCVLNLRISGGVRTSTPNWRNIQCQYS